MEYGYSPAPSVDVDADDFDNMTDEEMDRYFANCAPLSNLPTPPPAKDVSVLPPSPDSTVNAALLADPASSVNIPGNSTPSSGHAAQHLSPALVRVYAEHLCHPLPYNISRTANGLDDKVRWVLERASLSAEIVAFAACLLDSLSESFVSSWLAACCSPTSVSTSKEAFTLGESQPGPELVILSALNLAHAFLSDSERRTKVWASLCVYVFSVHEIEATKRCLLQDIDYGLTRITSEMVASKLREMHYALMNSPGQPAVGTWETSPLEKEEKKCPRLHLTWHGTAVWEYGMQTPEPSPRGNSPALC